MNFFGLFLMALWAAFTVHHMVVTWVGMASGVYKTVDCVVRLGITALSTALWVSIAGLG